MWHPNAQFPTHLKNADLFERNRYFSECFVLNHEHIGSCFQDVVTRIGRYKHWQIFHICGPTGIGKTELAHQIMEHVFEGAFDNGMIDGLPAVMLEVPNISSKVPDWKVIHKSFMRQINGFDFSKYRRMSDPKSKNKGRRFTGHRADEDDIQTAFKDMLGDLKTRVVIMDEVQHLLKLGKDVVKSILDEFKSFSNLTKCQLILVQTYESLDNLKLNGQLIRRSRVIHFSRYRWEVPDEQKAFIDAYSGMLAHVPFRLDESLLSLEVIRSVYTNCCGCIGVLKGLIEKAIFHLGEEEYLTPELLSGEFYTRSELMTLAKEIHHGESFFRCDTSVKEVEEVLGMTRKEAKKTSSKPLKSSKKKGRVGERIPVKDEVGCYAS